MDQATLMDKIKTGTTLCKAIMRNGYDAYAINAPLQGLIFEKTGVFDVDEHHPVRQPYPRLRARPRNHGRMAQSRRRIHVEVRAAPF